MLKLMVESNSRIEMLKEFLAADPADDFSEYALALEFEKTGNRKDALTHLEIILYRNPSYLAAYYQSGRMYEAEKNFNSAASMYEKGIEIARQQGNTKRMNELRTALEMLD
jgi:tetratricopeptide (TPR) repeat protein